MISSKNEVTQNVAEEIKPGQPLLEQTYENYKDNFTHDS